VRWEEDWPIVSPGTGRVEFSYPTPNLPEHPWSASPACDHFDAETLDLCWNFLRVPDEQSYSLSERPGHLRLYLRPQHMAEHSNPSFVGRRQQHIHFAAQTKIEFTPQAANECAGLVLTQNNEFHFRFVVIGGTSPTIQLVQRAHGEEKTLAEQDILNTGPLYLKVEAHEQSYSFYVATTPNQWQSLAENVDGRILSTPVAGGFVGAWIALYASSNGQPATNHADFDWFEYLGL